MTRATTERRRGLSLGARTFLVTATLIALAMGVAVVVTAVVGQRIARRGIERSLANAQAAQQAFQQLRAQRLQLMARLLGSDPFLAAYIAQAAEVVETRSILDILYERQRELGCDLLFALDPHGRLLARTDAPDATGGDLSQRPLVAQALAGREAAGVWDEEGTLHELAIVPLQKGLDLLGYLAIGFRIDDALAREVRGLSGTEMVVLARRAGETRAVASTLPVEATATVAAAIGRRWPEGATAAVATELRVNGGPWIARVLPLPGERDAGLGAIVALASLSEAMATYRRIETLLVVVGLAAMLLAFAVSYPLSHRLLRPLRRLASAAEAARRGDYEQDVESGGDDEVARLARSVRALLSDLRERRDMQLYLTDLADNVAAAATVHAGMPTAGSEQPTIALDRGPVGPGAVLGNRFEVLEVVGSGGMGVVYRAHDRQVDGVVALKLLKPEVVGDPEHLERMRSEIRLARRVTHVNVVRTHDFLILDGRPVISMEYVHGLTLRQLLTRSGRLPYSAGLHLAREMCAGLAAAHQEGVLHGDLKPENLILQQSGNAKLADFGIARLTRRGAQDAGEVATPAGTPRYMAPEVLRGQVPDARADLYAVGVVLHEIFTGRPPFAEQSVAELLRANLERPVPPPRTHWPEMPGPLEQVILRCLEKERDRRHASVAELLADLESLRDEIAPAPARRPPGASPVVLAMLALAAAVASPAACGAAPSPPGSGDAMSASDPGAEEAGSPWWIEGDLRVRGDFVRGLPGGRADLARARSFLRLGFASAPRPWLELAIFGKAALGSDGNFDNPQNFDNEHSDSLSLDGARVRVGPLSGATLAAGKLEQPLWLTPLVWDEDLRPIGVAATYRLDVRAYDALRLAGGWFATDHLYGDGSQFAAAQAGWLWQPGAPWNGEALVGVVAFSNLDELPVELFRTNLARAGALVSDYRLVDTQVALRFPALRTSAALRLDLVRNLGADADDDAVRALAVVGDATRARGLEVAYAYQRIERDAVLAAVNGDDWWFHSRSKGHMLRVTFGVSEQLRLRLSTFLERRDDLGEDTRRLLVEVMAAR